MFMIFLCLDRFNPAMDFVGSVQGRILLAILCVLSFVGSLLSALHLYRLRVRALERAASAPQHPPAAHRYAEAAIERQPQQRSRAQAR